MIRIVHVISDLDIGGAEVMLAKLVAGMDRRRFSNTVVSLIDRGRLGDGIESSGVPVHCLGMTRGRPDIRAITKLVRILKTVKPHLVQSWLYHADLLSLLAVRFAGNPPLVWNLRCSDMDLVQYSRQTRWVRRLLSLCSRIPVGVIANSVAGQTQHQQFGYRPRCWKIIPNGFDTDRFRPDRIAASRIRSELRLPDGAILIALVARIDPMKDHTTFLLAARQVVAVRTRVHVLLIGAGTQSLADRVAHLGLSDHVYLLGPRDDIDRLLPGVDVACLSSAFGEGFPNVLGEAMACGVPCVATDVGDTRTIIGDTGLIVPPRDPQALAAAIIDLIDRGSAVRGQLGLAARERVTAEYSLARVIDLYQAFYDNLATCIPNS